MTFPVRGDRKWLVIGLVISLGLNLLLGGLAFEAPILRHFKGPELTGPDAAIEKIAQRLPDADARVLRDAFARAGVPLHRLVEEQRGTHEQIRIALTATPFDPAAFERQMAISLDQRQAFTTLMAGVFRSALEAMSADGRAAFARNDRDAHRS